ncbi:metallophosphoesterase family protein [Paenibacillus koleovorans]|uniref:metallophosphoesterase family protein n=1 Tax=Paenibacillus koleovorans TaxID=121608 RepID=UPI000FD711A8|nr:metallophosphoesterase [Paenibacillus koleovorans]
MKLALLGDLHYPHLSGDAAVVALRDSWFGGVLKSFLDVEADIHISLGDLTNEGRADELRDVYGAVDGHVPPRRFVHVLGNHDTLAMGKREWMASTGQARYFALERAEATLVFLDTAKEGRADDFGGELDAEQAEWLGRIVRESGEKPLLVFGHHPLVDTTTNSEQPMFGFHREADPWPILRGKRGRGFYFCGHNHAHSIVKREQWHFIQTAACLDTAAVRTVELRGGELTVGLLTFDDEARRREADALAASMKLFTPKQLARGTIADHGLTVNLLPTERNGER